MEQNVKDVCSPSSFYHRPRVEFFPCYVSSSMQIQLNNLLILISKSSFAIELHPLPSRGYNPPCHHPPSSHEPFFLNPNPES